MTAFYSNNTSEHHWLNLWRGKQYCQDFQLQTHTLHLSINWHSTWSIITINRNGKQNNGNKIRDHQFQDFDSWMSWVPLRQNRMYGVLHLLDQVSPVTRMETNIGTCSRTNPSLFFMTLAWRILFSVQSLKWKCSHWLLAALFIIKSAHLVLSN